MKKQVTWTLRSGAEATYSIEITLEKEINLDGDKSIVPCCEIHARFNIPGVGYIPGDMITEKSGCSNGFNFVAVIGNKAAISAEVYAEIKAATAEVKAHPAWVAKQSAIARNERDQKALYATRIKNGMCPKCHTYCYGDCGL